MDDLTTIQIFARARALMIEERNNGSDDKFVVASMKSIDSRLLEDQTKSVCFECKLPNHFARDCHVRRNNNQESRIWTHFKNASKKQCEGEDVCSSSLPNQSVMALPTVRRENERN